MPKGYLLGCPAWGDKTWVGRLFPKGTKQGEFLERYAQVFDTVEGNTTFYALPKKDTVAKWRDTVPDHFRFCFKFPRKITHEKLLKDSDDYVAGFLERVAPLGAKLGVLMLQLPPRFGPRQLERLDGFLERLPRSDFRFAVELRHAAFFNGADEEAEAAAVLRKHQVDTVLMDARGLHASDAPELAEVRRRKPDLPVVMRATGKHPVVRVVPHPDFAGQVRFVAPWVEQLATWIEAGLQPFFFMHAPRDTFAPENAYAFHRMLAERVAVGELPPWPAEQLELLG